jgi:hypothetical protein
MTGKVTCTICGKEIPGCGVTIVLRSRDGNGKETVLGAATTCTGCHVKIVAESPGIIGCSLKAILSTGKDSYLATYCKHLERRLRELEIETKAVDMQAMETERDAAMNQGHVTFLEKIIKNCKSCSSLFAREKDKD